MTGLLDVHDLVKDFAVPRRDGFGKERLVAVEDVSFSIPPAGSLAIVGESGSGKSTTARVVVGLERATSGSLTVDGADWDPTRTVGTREQRERGGMIQMVFQDPYQSLDRRQRIGDCLDEALRLHTDLDRPARRARVAELLDQVGLGENHAESFPRGLSGGQRQRVAIARALAAGPRILILDEAVSALDLSVQAQVLRLLARIRRETGVSYLFISHDLNVVRSVCDDVVVMRKGRVVESGDIARVLDSPAESYTRRLIESIPRRGWTPRRRSQPV
ncbi:ABC transporter ATP-binding protein [Streptomyces sp. NPDC056390]|uniref:ABC transporter ATP-binding protein n=1 Tax=Streptomyces sp. NPDC056390 TaxID=3345806 RepID=UPI0035DA1CA5